MHGGLPYRMLAGAAALAHRLRIGPLATMSLPQARGYARMVTYMLRARAWTWRRGEPGWPALQRGWALAAASPAARDELAGRLHADDRITLIADGPAAFERREALYAGAARTIDFATYYVQADATGRATIAALADCVQRGVRVRLLVDRFISAKKTIEVRGTQALLQRARAAGIELRTWHDPRRPFDANHRKMLVVDGRTALVGGRNIADHYRGNAWRDLDLQIDGPAAAALARVFESVWQGASAGADGAHGVAPWVDRVPADIAADPVQRFVLSAVGTARTSIDLELAYFVAHDALCDALGAAARRGVRVRLLTNSAESNDLPFTVWTAHEGMRRLLEAGAEVFLRRGAGRTLHCKYALVDGEWVSFGSHNLDYYASRYCCECNLVVRDRPLAAQLGAFFDAGVADATPLDRAEAARVLARGRWGRVFDHVFKDFQ